MTNQNDKATDFLPLFQCHTLRDQVCDKRHFDKCIAEGMDDNDACGESLVFEGVNPVLAAYIVQSANEYDALKAVEAAAEKLQKAKHLLYSGDTVELCHSNLDSALSALSAIRGGGK